MHYLCGVMCWYGECNAFLVTMKNATKKKHLCVVI